MSNRIVSIQVAATIDRKLGQEESEFEMTSADCPDKTHWSVYTRNEGGDCDHCVDFPVDTHFSKKFKARAEHRARVQAVFYAAELSMEHSVFIEKIR